jgi:N-acetylmuramoyl-L-alanine amidase
MKVPFATTAWIAVLSAGIAALFLPGPETHAADSDISTKVVVTVSADGGSIRTPSSHFIRPAELAMTASPLSPPAARVSARPIGKIAAATRQEPAAPAAQTAPAAPATTAPPTTPPTTAAPAVPAAKTITTGVRVIVIDPGHGGIDTGASTTGALEKDITLAIARKMRTTLQSRLGATVLLTRDSDIALTSEARTAVANNNRADLFISLHIGYSANKADLGSSVYVIQDNFAASIQPSTDKTPRLFQPWYLGYQKNRDSSVKAATVLSEELSNSLPGWNFPVRTGPVGVLVSTIMPAVLIEIGNLNNPASTQALLDESFQSKLGTTFAAAIERFSPPPQVSK